MDPGLRTSASGMIAQQRMIDVIANNLANVNTTGFKRSRVNFKDTLYQTLGGTAVQGAPGAGSLPAVQLGMGVQIGGVLRLHMQGSAVATQQPLDVAIDGEGFFQVERPDGVTAFTRDGSFGVSEAGALVTNTGYLVVPGITIPPDSTNVNISAGGVVTVTGALGAEPVEVGRIELVRFLNPAGLLSLGENQFGQTAASGAPIRGLPQEEGFGRLLQGSLEASNVEIVQEMTDMIAAQRAYEINAKAIQAGEEMMDATSQLIR